MAQHESAGQSAGRGVRDYAIVTAAYWGFTLTDGALRMLVLLHFYQLGYSPFTLAFLFLLYEAAGVVANLVGGWLAQHHGNVSVFVFGLVLVALWLLVAAGMKPPAPRAAQAQASGSVQN